MNQFTVEFYEKENGEIPVEEFLDSLDIGMKSKLVMILKVLQEKKQFLQTEKQYQLRKKRKLLQMMQVTLQLILQM